MPHRVFLLCPFQEVSGGEEYILSIIENIDKEKYECLAGVPQPGDLAQRLKKIGVKTFFVSQNRLKARNPLPFLKTVLRIYKLIKREKVALLYATTFNSNQYGVFAAKAAGIPVVCAAVNLSGKRATRRSFARWADRIIVISRAVEELMIGHGIDRRKIRLIYVPVDPDKYKPSPAARNQFRAEFGIADHEFVVGIVGRILRLKGHHVVIEALHEVVQQEPEVTLLVVGDTTSTHPDMLERPYLEQVRRLVGELGLEGKVIFTGHHPDIWKAFNAMDTLVLASHGEAFGRVLIEAMATEKPVVATNAGGVPEVVVDGETGFLVPVGQPAPLAEAILRLVRDKELAFALGKQGRKRVSTYFSLEKAVTQHEQLFQQLLQPGAKP